MPISLKLPRRSPAAPRLSLRDRLAAMKGSAAKVMRRPPAGIVRPKLPGAGTPSKAVTAALAAHEMAYGYALYAGAYGLPDIAERRQAEEEAFRALLHTPLTSDADRAAYAAAVISRQAHSLGDGSATECDHPLAVAFRNIALGEHAREPETMRHVGCPAEPAPAADPILSAIAASKAATAAFDAFEAELERYGKTSGWAVRERHLSDADLKAQKAVWQTVPTTPAGRRAIVEFARTQVRRRTHPDGDVDDSPWLLGLILDAFAAMVDAVPAEAQGTAVASMGDDPRSGLIVYADASGKLSRKPVDQALSFMAMRLRAVANTELSRRFNAEHKGMDEAGCRELDARLRRELRLDALDILAHRHDEAFAAAQVVADVEKNALLSAEQVDLSALGPRELSHLYEAFQVVKFEWEGVVSRPYNADGGLRGIPDFEEARASWIADRIEREIASRIPNADSEDDRDDILSIRVQHELRCNGRIHDKALLLDISRAWID